MLRFISWFTMRFISWFTIWNFLSCCPTPWFWHEVGRLEKTGDPCVFSWKLFSTFCAVLFVCLNKHLTPKWHLLFRNFLHISWPCSFVICFIFVADEFILLQDDVIEVTFTIIFSIVWRKISARFEWLPMHILVVNVYLFLVSEIQFRIFETPSLPNLKSYAPDILRQYSPTPVCRVSHVTYHVSCVTCHISRITCHMTSLLGTWHF